MSGVEIRTVAASEDGMRLDRWFRQHYPGLKHGRLEKLLRTGQIRVEGARAKASTRLEEGQSLRVPPLGDTTPREEMSAGRLHLPLRPPTEPVESSRKTEDQP